MKVEAAKVRITKKLRLLGSRLSSYRGVASVYMLFRILVLCGKRVACLVLGSIASKQQPVGISNGRSEGIYFRSIYSNFLLHVACCKGPGTAEKSATSLISLMSFNCLFHWTFARFL